MGIAEIYIMFLRKLKIQILGFINLESKKKRRSEIDNGDQFLSQILTLDTQRVFLPNRSNGPVWSSSRDVHTK